MLERIKRGNEWLWIFVKICMIIIGIITLILIFLSLSYDYEEEYTQPVENTTTVEKKIDIMEILYQTIEYIKDHLVVAIFAVIGII